MEARNVLVVAGVEGAWTRNALVAGGAGAGDDAGGPKVNALVDAGAGDDAGAGVLNTLVVGLVVGPQVNDLISGGA